MMHKLIREARSTRRFDACDPIPADTLVALVDLARLAPSAGNRQPLRYRIVGGAECDALFSCTRWAGALKDWPGPERHERPTGYIAILSLAGKPAPGVDIGIAAGIMQLAATEDNWRACMLGAFDPVAVAAALSVPPEWTVRLLVAFGRGRENINLVEGMPADERAYWRDEAGVHYVPKRTLDEILLPPVPARCAGAADQYPTTT